ncbi:MAG: hypothetical protein Q8P01_05285 [bacterium]|nr:hypothetical protein [bacterium]
MKKVENSPPAGGVESRIYMEEEQKKFCEAEIILGVFFFAGIDGIAILLDLTVVGLAIAPFIQAFALGVMIFWFWWKGNKQAIQLGRVVAKFLATAIPIIPTNLIIFAVSSYYHNHPEKVGLLQRLQRSMKIAGRVAGGKPVVLRMTDENIRQANELAKFRVGRRTVGAPADFPSTGTEG